MSPKDIQTYRESLLNQCNHQVTILPHSSGDEEKNIILDPHQQVAMDEVCVGLEDDRDAFSIVHSCGSGKTIIEANLLQASQFAKQILGSENTQDVLLTVERALIHSIREQLMDIGLDVGIWGGGEKVLDRPIVLATAQALQMNKDKLNKLLPPENIRLLLGDEADTFLTQKRMELIQKFQNALRVGLTATDKWPDGRDIVDLWGKKIHQLNLKEGIRQGINIPPLFYLFEANLNEEDLIIQAADYDKKSLNAGLKAAEIHKAIPEIYQSLVPKEQRKDYPTLIYVPSVDLVHAVVETMQEKYAKEGVKINGWTGDTMTSTKIKSDMNSFNDGDLDVLVLCEMGGRGLNLVRARCLIDGYPTLSPNKLEQRHGRISRKIRDNTELANSGFKKNFALIAQIVPKSNSFRPYLLPDLLDCWDDFRKGRLLATRERKEPQKDIDTNGRGAAVQAEVDAVREYIESQDPKAEVALVRRIDIYEQLKLRDELPQANEDGFFELDGEKYGAKTFWAKYLNIEYEAIGSRLKDLKGKTAKNSMGRIWKDTFYSESIVREKCADLLEEMPQADEDGFFIYKGEKHGTFVVWERMLGISRVTMKRRLNGIEGVKGKIPKSGIFYFFPKSLVCEKCSDLLESMPRANNDGFFVLEGEKYGTVGPWAKELNVSPETISNRLKGCQGMKGKIHGGQIARFYPESIVKEKFVDHFEEMPQANDDGIFVHQGEKHMRIYEWSGLLNISDITIKNKLDGIKGMKGKIGGNVYKFFPESLVLKRCAYLLKVMPQANKEGFFELKGEKYMTKTRWSEELNINLRAQNSLLEGLKGITGKDFGGVIREDAFYSELIVREKCVDLLTGSIEKSKAPQANEEGLFELKGEKYMTKTRWGEVLNISPPAIRRRLKKIKGITGKDSNGYMRKNVYYSESIVREACADLLKDLSQANKEGFFYFKGERYGMRTAWKRELSIDRPTLRKRFKGLKSLTGKDSMRLIREFYSESIVFEKCADLLAKKTARENKKKNEES